MKKMTLGLVALLATVFACSCAGESKEKGTEEAVAVAAAGGEVVEVRGTDASVFEGKKMILVSFAEGEAVSAELQEPVSAMFTKEDSKVNGFAGCNRFFGDYVIAEGSIKFDKVGCTKMMCDPVSNDVETKVLNIFNTATRFETTEHSVIFYNGEERLGEFCSEGCHAKCADKKCVKGETAPTKPHTCTPAQAAKCAQMGALKKDCNIQQAEPIKMGSKK